MAVTLPYPNIKAGDSIIAAELKLNFAALATEVNGNLDTNSLKANAGILASQLEAIADASKVDGAALFNLGNIPAGGGTIPSANVRKSLSIKISSDTEAPLAGDGAYYFTCPVELNGMNLVLAHASVITASTSGTPTVQIARGRRSAANGACTYSDMLSTRITIDENEYDSVNAATAPVINTSNDDIVVSSYVDILRIDVDTAGSGTTGLEVRLSFQTP